MSVFTCMMARFYDRAMAKAEAGVLGQWRDECVSSLSGRVLELGAGTGVNLSRYSDRVDELILTEPDSHFLPLLRERCGSEGHGRETVIAAQAEALPIPSESVDAIVSTLVLCSVPSQERALAECRRVLRPGGALVVIEHVVATQRAVRVLQYGLDPFQRLIAGGCRLTRDTEQSIALAGFECAGLKRGQLLPSPVHLRDCVYGVAMRA